MKTTTATDVASGVPRQTTYEEHGCRVTRTSAWSPPGCHPVGCGLKLYVKDNKLVKVKGDEEHPITQGRLCIRCLSLPEYVHHPDRLTYPLKRTGQRGENKWARISWDEAYDTIASKTREITKKYGAESIINLIGTGRQSAFSDSGMCHAVLCSPNNTYAQSGYACYLPRATVTSYALGASYPEIDYAAQFPDRFENPEFRLPKYIVIWGKSPIQSNPDGFFGHAVVDMMKRGSKIIVVDPRMTWLASRADVWLQVRPGTDTALALGMLNVIINEGLYDVEFVDKWCHGFEALKERSQQYPPEKVAEITWVPKEKIIEASRKFATAKPSSIQWGLATDQKPNGLQHAHAICALMAITGNIDVPGGNTIGTIPLLATVIGGVQDTLPEDLKQKTIGRQKYPAYYDLFRQSHADLTLEALESGKPYPIKMAFIKASNPLACTSSAPRRWHKALKALDFVFASDVFMTPSISACADIVLPLATFAEADGVVAIQFGNVGTMVSAINKALTVGECKSDYEIMLELGKRLNPELWPYNNARELLTGYVLKPSLGITFDELCAKGWMYIPFSYKKYETGKLRPDGQLGFMTPTGRVELASTMFEQLGEDPLPYYEEPPYSPYSTPELAKEYPFVLTTGARNFGYFHSEHRQIKTLRDLHPDPIVQLHPDTAKSLGIKEGDWVWIENMLGKCKQKVELLAGMHPKVVHAEHGWWFPEKAGGEPSLFGVWEANVNQLVPNNAVGRLGFGAPFKCMICKVYKAGDDISSEA